MVPTKHNLLPQQKSIKTILKINKVSDFKGSDKQFFENKLK